MNTPRFFNQIDANLKTCDTLKLLDQEQIEHEIRQIIWQGSKAESLCFPRITHWMAGGMDILFWEIGLVNRMNTGIHDQDVEIGIPVEMVTRKIRTEMGAISSLTSGKGNR